MADLFVHADHLFILSINISLEETTTFVFF